MSKRLILGLVGLSSAGVLLGRRGGKRKKQVDPTAGSRGSVHKLHVIPDPKNAKELTVAHGGGEKDTITWVARTVSIGGFGIKFEKTKFPLLCNGSPCPTDGTPVYSTPDPATGKATITCEVGDCAADTPPDLSDLLFYSIVEQPSAHVPKHKGKDKGKHNDKGGPVLCLRICKLC